MKRKRRGPHNCYRTKRPGAVCEVCHKVVDVLHISLAARAFTCDRCCLNCNALVRLRGGAGRAAATGGGDRIMRGFSTVPLADSLIPAAEHFDLKKSSYGH